MAEQTSRTASGKRCAKPRYHKNHARKKGAGNRSAAFAKTIRFTQNGGVYSLRSVCARALLCSVCAALLFVVGAAIGTLIQGRGAFAQSGKLDKANLQKPPYALATAPPYTVVIDAGHGDMDTGARGIIQEIELCEATTDALIELFAQDKNYCAVRARETGTDPGSAERAEVATACKASLFLSIHGNCDHSSSQSHGFECFPTPPGRLYSEESMRFAQCIAAGMKAAGHRLRGDTGIRFAYYNGKSKRMVDSSDTKVRTAKSFGVVEKTYCPSVLAEQCFITNAADVKKWASAEGCSTAARVYYEAICAYFGTEPIKP